MIHRSTEKAFTTEDTEGAEKSNDDLRVLRDLRGKNNHSA